MKILSLFVLAATLSVSAQEVGKWHDVSKDGDKVYFIGNNDKEIISEEYEILKTHEICATVFGYSLEKSGIQHYIVNFEGNRSGRFVYTTLTSAEDMVVSACTPITWSPLPKKGK